MDSINNSLEFKLKEYKTQKIKIEKENSLYEEKIIELNQILKNNLENKEKEKYESKINSFKKEKEKNKKKLTEIVREINDIEKCKKEIISNPINQNIFESLNKYSHLEIEKLVNSFNFSEQENIIKSLKEKLLILFDNLFDYEKANEKINNTFINTIKSNINVKPLVKMNFIVVGCGGVGKTTLIHQILNEQVKRKIVGNKIKYEKYESKIVPFLHFFEIMREDIITNNGIANVIKEIIEERENHFDQSDPNEYIHCIIYCLTGNRINIEELNKLLTLRKKYGVYKLPIVIVYTNTINDEDAENVKKYINKILNDYNESLNDDNIGISFIKLNARERKLETNNEIFYIPSFGLAQLVDICFKKGENLYKYKIRNLLIEYYKIKIKEYLDNICSDILNNNDYFKYLNRQFEPNFSDLIAYSLEKIIDINEQKGINNEDLNKIKNYLNYQYINEYQNQIKDNNEITGENKILNNNLTLESKIKIKNYIEIFKSEINEAIQDKLNLFSNNISNIIYSEVLDEHIKLNNNQIKAEEKGKETEFRKDALEKIKIATKEKTKEYLLSKLSAQFFQDLILKFKDKFIVKLNEFVNNLDINKDGNELFKYWDDLNIDKNIKFKDNLLELIKNLKQKEKESEEKALKSYKISGGE